MTLPPAGTLVALVHEKGPGALDAYAPEIDALADIPAIAEYLGVKTASIYRDRARMRTVGATPRWPDPEPFPGRTPFWKWRTIIVYRATMPGPGNRVRGPRPRKPKPSPPPIEDLNLTVRTYNCLKRAGIDTVAELAGLTDRDLLDVPNLGPKSFAEVRQAVAVSGE